MRTQGNFHAPEHRYEAAAIKAEPQESIDNPTPKTSQRDTPSVSRALRVLGPFAKQDGFYFRVVWHNRSRVLHSKSFRTANRWSAKIQRYIAESNLNISATNTATT